MTCHPGYKAVGSEIITCLANQTFSAVPECVGEFL